MVLRKSGLYPLYNNYYSVFICIYSMVMYYYNWLVVQTHHLEK